ncbi:MAG: site-specific integrase [Oscillospiraceae bacterium]|nr:site-specific integrase [Oscillospiraceae bacterium]
MKIPEPRKLPSGSWNVRVQIDGVTRSITRPTKKACIQDAAALKTGIRNAPKKNEATLSAAIDRYISDRANVLSPSTIRGYRAIQRLRFQPMMQRNIDTINQEQWQRAVNQEAKLCSAKTLKNAWGFIASVIVDATGQRITVRLPQVVANDLPYLTAEQIPTFLDAIKGNYCEIAILLGLSSLRRSEILALRWEDIDLKKGCIYVRGAAVLDADGNLIQRKENKNTSSRRTVPFLLPQLRAAVEAADKSTEFVVTCNPNTIWSCTNKACRAAGLPEIGAHGLRRSFASLAYHLQIPEEITMKAGGWSDIYTMRKIYTKVSDLDITTQGERYEAFFGKLEQKTGTETENA